MIRAGIIGGAGYTAGELIRLLINHPDVELVWVNSTSNAGNRIDSVHQGLIGETDFVFIGDTPFEEVDVLFFCTPHGESRKFIESHEIPETMKIVETVLSGKINKSLVSEFQKHNTKAVGISGKDGFLIEAKKKITDNGDLGCVGEITKINTNIIETLIKSDFIPVISPVGTDKDANTYNINADSAAVEIAIALNAKKLVFLTDTDGVLFKEDDPNSLISELIPEEIELLIQNGTIKVGMIPKVNCCTKAVKEGVESVHIINGKILHSLLLEIYTKDGIGTIIEEK